MTHQYEVVYIFDSALEEAAINERLERFHALIRQDGIDAPAIDHWGKRALAYPIQKPRPGTARSRSLRPTRPRCRNLTAPSSSMTACCAISSS